MGWGRGPGLASAGDLLMNSGVRGAGSRNTAPLLSEGNSNSLMAQLRVALIDGVAVGAVEAGHPSEPLRTKSRQKRATR